MRQGGEGQEVFRDILLKARNGEWDLNGWRTLLGQRAYCNLSREEKLRFHHASRLLPANDEVSAFNRSNLESLGWS